jgi:hypothetical protein
VKRRPRRGIAAALTALVLLAACVFVAIVAIQAIIGRTPWLSYRTVDDALHKAHWADLIPAIAGGGAVLIGLVLLLAALLPGRLTVLPLAERADSGASRRSYRSTLRAAASTVDGVHAADVTLGRRTAVAKVRTDRTNTEGLADAVRGALERRLDQITPATRPNLKVRLNAARSRS